MVIRREDSGPTTIATEMDIQRAKIKLRTTYPNIQNLRFIYGSYLPKHLYFEVVDCARRLLLTAVPILVLRSTVLQVVLVLLISLFFNAILMEYKPFVLESDNKVAVSCQWVISLTLIASLCLRVDMTDEFSFGPEAVVSIVFSLYDVVAPACLSEISLNLCHGADVVMQGVFLTVMISAVLVYAAILSIVPIDPNDEKGDHENSDDSSERDTGLELKVLPGEDEDEQEEAVHNPLPIFESKSGQKNDLSTAQEFDDLN